MSTLLFAGGTVSTQPLPATCSGRTGVDGPVVAPELAAPLPATGLEALRDDRLFEMARQASALLEQQPSNDEWAPLVRWVQARVTGELSKRGLL